MNDGYIALLDSGIGGISMLLELIKVLPNEKYLYFGDNFNAPYGNKTIRELRRLTLKNIDFIKRYNIKILVIACNTLSVNLLSDIRDYSGLPTFGVFPPVETALKLGNKNLLIATKRTADNFKGIEGLTTLGLKNLAEDIEKNAFNLECLSLSELNDLSLVNGAQKISYYNTVILGCTHYFFVKNKIIDHFRPQKILFGEYFTAKSVKNFLLTSKSLVNYKRNKVLFVGDNAKFNQEFFNFCGQKYLKF